MPRVRALFGAAGSDLNKPRTNAQTLLFGAKNAHLPQAPFCLLADAPALPRNRPVARLSAAVEGRLLDYEAAEAISRALFPF